MNEPDRLLHGGSAWERELLSSGAEEAVPREISARMAATLGLAATSMPPPALPDPGLGAAAAAKATSGGLLLKLGVGVALVGAVTASWLVSPGRDVPEVVATGPAASGVVPVPLVEPSSRPTQDAPPERATGSAADEPSGAVSGFGERGGERRSGSAAVDERAPALRQRAAPPPSQPRPGVAEGVAASVEPRAVGDVAAEVQLLDAARTAIAAGEAERARRLLDRYEQRFAGGMLAREAAVLRRAAKAY